MLFEGKEIRDEQVLAFLKGGLSPMERTEFEAALARSAALRAELERHRALLDALEASSDRTVSERVREQIRQAITRRASDIHIVPGARDVSVQLRVDGLLHEIARYRKEEHTAVVDRWKALADVSVMERQLPQDGRTLVQEGGQEYDVRVCFSPGVTGERVVARILNRNGVFMGLDRLGLSADQVETVRRIVGRPNGVVLATGPTGSGKTTVLYSLLQTLIEPGHERLAIMTAEDPVEVLLEGVTQVHIRRQAGLTFPVALRSFLRQDPDVIMAGAIQDLESAEVLIEAAVSGHLALSSLHAPDAAGAITRLTDMGVVPFLVADTLNGIISTRLVRMPCRSCLTEYEPAAADRERLGLSTADGPLTHGAGCEACQGTGYRGRTSLFEVLEVGPDLGRTLRHADNMEQVAREWLARNGITMRDDARRKVKESLTTVEEAARVLPE